jgi:putative membrane-bound dehydrogenase-like protein
MMSRLPALAVLLLASTLALADKADPPVEESQPKPAPAWVKIIDHGTIDPRFKGYFLPEGVKLEIVAEAPAVINPVGLAFTDDGTPLVIEWRPDPGNNSLTHVEEITYKDGSKRKFATVRKKVKDVVKALRDTKAAGVYDASDVVLEDELPSALLPYDGWLYTASRGSVRRFKQSKLGGAYDVKEVIAQGFGGVGDHQVSGVTLGNDGWLYITAGDGDHFAEGSDGSRATVLRTGAVFRCRPDGSKLNVFAQGFRNPQRDVAFDVGYNLFHTDTDRIIGGKDEGCRLLHIPETGDFGWRSQPTEPRAPDVRGADRELPGTLPPLAKTGRGAPAGLLIYNEAFFPEHYRGLLFAPDALGKRICAYRVEPKGAGFEVVEEFVFLQSDDPLFRPCQMVAGPDGAIYVVDCRTDAFGEGRFWGDGKNGRIYRLTWTGTKDHPAIATRGKDTWAKIRKLSDEELLKALGSDNFSDRQRARQEAIRRGEKLTPALLKVIDDDDLDDQIRIHALGALLPQWNDGKVKEGLRKLLDDRSATLRRMVVETIGANPRLANDATSAVLVRMLARDEPKVRRAVTLALGRINGPGTADILVNTLVAEDGKDVVLHDGLVRAVEATGEAGMDRLHSVLESGVQKEIDHVVEVLTALRTRPAAGLIPKFLENPHVGIEQRAALLRAYNNFFLDPPLVLDPIAEYLTKHPDEALPVRLAALETLALAHSKGGDKVPAWLLKQLERDDPATRIPLLRAVAAWRLTAAQPLLAKLLDDREFPAKDRDAASAALRIVQGMALDFWVVGPFGDRLAEMYAPEKNADLSATYPGKSDQALKWESRRAESSGFLNLRANLTATPSSAFALTYVHAPQAQKATMLLGVGGAVRVWINDELTHEQAKPQLAAADQQKVTVGLKEGWNKVLVKLTGDGTDGGVYLRFEGDGLRVSRTREK